MTTRLPSLEPPVQIAKRKNDNFKLPPLDNILDLCKSREDFPQHLINQNGKRRSSLVHEYLLEKEESNKRQRAFSVDQKNGYQIFSWHQHDPVAVKTNPNRRHSMFEPGATIPLNEIGFRKGVIRPWTVEEDSKLLAAVKAFGSNWTRIAEELPERNRRQCKEHWFRVLSKRPCAQDVVLDATSPKEDVKLASPIPSSPKEEDNSRRGLWSQDEDEKLLKAYNELGPRWPAISARVPGRNQRQCEKRFRRIKKASEEFESKPPSAQPNDAPANSATDSLLVLAALATANPTPVSC